MLQGNCPALLILYVLKQNLTKFVKTGYKHLVFVILLPQPPKQLGFQACSISPHKIPLVYNSPILKHLALVPKCTKTYPKKEMQFLQKEDKPPLLPTVVQLRFPSTSNFFRLSDTHDRNPRLPPHKERGPLCLFSIHFYSNEEQRFPLVLPAGNVQHIGKIRSRGKLISRCREIPFPKQDSSLSTEERHNKGLILGDYKCASLGSALSFLAQSPLPPLHKPPSP